MSTFADLTVGQTVDIKDAGKGTIRYLGQPPFATGDWVGVELAEANGKNDGSVKGERYFDCEPFKGMFVRPTAVTILAQAPPRRASVATAKKPAARPSSVSTGPGRRQSLAPDTAAGKRKSLNTASPSPAPRRPSSMLRSPTKSPTKQLVSAGTSSAGTSRTGTPASRPPSISAPKTRPGAVAARTSMGPPATPASRARLSTVGSKTTGPSSRAPTGRASLAPKRTTKPSVGRVTSIDNQLNSEEAVHGSGSDAQDEEGIPDTFSPQTVSPVMSRAAASSPGSASRNSGSPATQRGAAMSTAATRKITDLETKIQVLSKKREEDREKLKSLEKVQAEKEKYEGIIEALRKKYQPQQQEITDLRKQLKEASSQFEEIESIQAEHDVVLEMATLDREMAEEQAEAFKAELEALKLKAEELELEVEVLREENTELGGELSPEEKTSQSYLQLERKTERLTEALWRLRDISQETESELREEMKSLQEDVREFDVVKEHYEVVKEKLALSEAAIEDLRQQLDNALGAEDMIEELTERNMSMAEQIEELNATIEDLESLKEINDELEINHVETEKEMQEELDFKDSIITEQARRASQQEEALEDMGYTLSRFRELVTSLQGDLEDMRASHAVTETESEQLNSRSRAMLDLNLKLQVSASKTQVKTIDLELRRLDAQEASEHLAIVQLFLPEAFQAERDSVLALLRFRRVAFKANMLHGFVKERVNGSASNGHEDDIFAGCDVLDKLSWVSAMCDRFVNAISHCSTEEFARYEGALYELEPVERALNGWIDGLRRDELKEKHCATELQRTIALMSHLAEVHISTGLASYADDIHMRTMVMQSHLETAASAITAVKTMVQAKIPSQGDEDELYQFFARKTEAIITQTRSAKVVIGKAVRSLEDMKARSLSLMPDTLQQFEQCESSALELAKFSRDIGFDLFALLREEGRPAPFTYVEVQNTVHQTTNTVFQSSEADLFSTYTNKLRTLFSELTDLATLASDLEMTQEFELAAAPWVLRSQEFKTSKSVPVDAEEEMRRLRDDNRERARLIALRDQTLEEASVKIELLESRMRDAGKKTERIVELEKKLEEAKLKEAELAEGIEGQGREIAGLEKEREEWRKVAEENRLVGQIAVGGKAGQERAVATAREMDALKMEIESLQAAVRYLREDNRRARLADPSGIAESGGLGWLDVPLVKQKSISEQRRELVLAEGKDVLNELLALTATASLYNFEALPRNKLEWRPKRSGPQWFVAKQREEWEEWKGWSDSVSKKGRGIIARDAMRGLGVGSGKGNKGRKPAARVEMRFPEWDGKVGLGKEVEIVGSREWEGFRGGLGFV